MATVLTNVGKSMIAKRLLPTADPNYQANDPKYIAWGGGGGTSPAAITDTALATEFAEARATGTPSLDLVNVTNDTYKVVGTLTATAARTVTEAGLLDQTKAAAGAVPVGQLMVRGDFGAVNLQSGDSIQFTIKVTFQ